jgi:hypothetical protein
MQNHRAAAARTAAARATEEKLHNAVATWRMRWARIFAYASAAEICESLPKAAAEGWGLVEEINRTDAGARAAVQKALADWGRMGGA